MVWGVLGSGLLVGACGEEDVPSRSRFAIERTLEDCAFASRAIDPDEPTSFGVNAEQLVRWIVAEHSGPLEWQNHIAAFGPEVGLSQISLQVEQRDSPRWIEARIENPQGREVYCRNSLVLPVRLHVSTAGGALDETLDTTLLASSRDLASGSVLLPTNSLLGSFFNGPAVAASAPVPALILAFDLLPYAQRGTLEYDRAQPVAGLDDAAVIAHFPPLGTCPDDQFAIDPLQPIHDVSRADVIDQLNSDSPVTIEPGATTLELSFEDTGEPTCAAIRSPDGITSFDFSARATLRSSDGRVDGNVSAKTTALFAVELGGVPGEPQLASVVAERSSFHESPAEASAAASEYAIREPLDFSDYPRQYIDFSQQVAGATQGGWLRAIGLAPASPPCERTPDPRTDCLTPTGVFELRWGNRELLRPTPFASERTLP